MQRTIASVLLDFVCAMLVAFRSEQCLFSTVSSASVASWKRQKPMVCLTRTVAKWHQELVSVMAIGCSVVHASGAHSDRANVKPLWNHPVCACSSHMCLSER